MDLGCYPCHWVRILTDETPSVVNATSYEGSPGIDLVTIANLVFPSGATARLRTSMERGADRVAIFKVTGTNGILTFINPLSPHRGHEISLRQNGKASYYSVDGLTTYDHQLSHVLDVLAGRTVPLTGGEDAVANMVLIDSIYSAGGLGARGTSA